MLTGKKITLGIAGGIAAYKTAELASSLVKNGAEVRTIMTASAQQFISPQTFSALTNNAVYTDMFQTPQIGGVNHIDLAQNTDLLVVAPATANIIAKAAHGIADDLLSTVIIAAGCPVIFCPAMNTQMYINPVVQQNIKKLQQLGYWFVGPNTGKLACGTSGPGRMSEPQEILAQIKNILTPGELKGTKLLITAGPTREPLDPVRYLTNRSSGKMGYSIAQAALEKGAEVTLISGPVNLPAPAGAELIYVETAEQMYNAVMAHYDDADIVIKAAAVADYRPKSVAKEKIKKDDESLVIELEKNPDILAELGKQKKDQILVGFAAETNNAEENAKKKLQRKNLDMLVLNNVSLPGAGFDVDTNIVTIMRRDGAVLELPLMSKQAVARRILEEIVSYRSKLPNE